MHRLRVRKGKQALPFFEHDYPERAAAIAASIVVYRRLKDNGFHDVPRPV